MSIHDSKKELLDFLKIKEDFVYINFSNLYKSKIKIKKSGGFRKIDSPKRKLKGIQRKILDEILSKKAFLPCIFGLNKKGIRDNATFHQANAKYYFIKIDLKDFFPTINYKKVKVVFASLGFNEEISNILTKICTINKYLPQGSPTSSTLSILCSENLDKKYIIIVKIGIFYIQDTSMTLQYQEKI